MEMNEKEVSKRSTEGTNTDRKVTRSEMYRDVLYVIAWITLGQGLCFLGAATIQNDVSVLPDDPFTLIGSLYIGMGLGLILISRLCGRKSSELDAHTSCEKCSHEAMAQDSKEINQRAINSEKRQLEELRTKNNKEMDDQKSTDFEDSSRKPENLAEVAEAHNQQWDIVDSLSDVKTDKTLEIKNIGAGCDEVIIPASK